MAVDEMNGWHHRLNGHEFEQTLGDGKGQGRKMSNTICYHLYIEKGKATHSKYSGLENSMDYIVHGVAKSWTRLSDFHFILMSFTGWVLIQDL